MKKVTIFITTLLITISIVKAQNKSNILLGTWEIIKTISSTPQYRLNKEESKQFVGDTVVFQLNRIIAPKNNTFYGGCSSPTYKFKTVNAMEYYNNDRQYLKLIGINTANIEIAETSCGLPFASIHIINKNKIDIGVDGYRYFLERIK
jgi:hypothetical protein